MQITDTAIDGVKIIEPKRHSDPRGLFCEVYNQAQWRAAGMDLAFVQDNQSLSRPRGTVRGLHFQTAPFAQDKLVRVLRGRIFDVAVDLRRSSPTFGRHVGVELSAENWRQLLVPIGFAHGFCTLEPETEVFYKVTNFYSGANDRGIAFDDPDIGVDWPVATAEAILSDKDRKLPRLRDVVELFD
jgi:dTDP-4-dehydrorhamnose 3,5-epimerase